MRKQEIPGPKNFTKGNGGKNTKFPGGESPCCSNVIDCRLAIYIEAVTLDEMLPHQSLGWKFAGYKMFVSLKTQLTLANPGDTKKQ